jgi:hypothetical protein
MDVDFLKGLVVFPLAIFSNVFGVAGGFGLGTLGFDFLFAHLFHIPGGASVGLAFQVLTAATRLLGLPFFLWDHNASAGKATSFAKMKTSSHHRFIKN